jgi:hypothetical protein
VGVREQTDRRTFLIGTAGWFAGCLGGVARAQAPDVPSFARDLPRFRSAPPVLAFNGKDLTGFYTYLHDHKYEDPDGVFTVREGLLVISGREFGGLTTRQEYGEYHLITEWKWGEKTWPPRVDRARDSGILLHCVGPDGAASGHWMQSQECQIIEGGCGDFIMVPGLAKPRLTCEVRFGPDRQPYFEKGAKSVTKDSGRFNWWGRAPDWKDVLGFRGRRDVESPAGEWNRMEVVCDGDTITNIVNGLVVNAGSGSSLTRGKLIFQSEGAEIVFRKIEVRTLIK